MVSCTWNPASPSLLVEADKMLEQGNYEAADSLLTIFDNGGNGINKADVAYRQLLALERRFVIFGLSGDDYSLTDSLCRYYYGNNSRKSAMAQIFLAEIFRSSGDYPSALSTLLKAEHSVEESEDLLLQIWKNRMYGDIFFEQGMHSESIVHYQKYYSAAIKKRDTLRIAQSSFSMARVWIIKNNIDSVVFYLNQAIRMGKNTSVSNTIVVPSMSVLADIYIQTEQFDQAAKLLTRDSIDDENWAHWHISQHQSDSAIFYFKKMLGNYGWRADVAYLHNLAELEEERGNRHAALTYYKQLCAAKDSLKVHSKIEETHQTELQHHFNLIKQERDEAERHNRHMRYLLLGMFIASVVLVIIVCLLWKNFRSKKEGELLQRKLMLQEEIRKNKQSLKQIETNEQQIAQLERRLKEALTQSDAVTAQRLQLESTLLMVENENIKVRQRRDKQLINDLVQSPLYERIKESAGKEGFHLTDDEWLSLAGMIDQAYDGFTSRLRMLYDGISEYELHVCYLLKIGISSTDIGNMLCKSKSAIGMTRQRLYRKLTGTKGTAREMNDFILDF